MFSYPPFRRHLGCALALISLILGTVGFTARVVTSDQIDADAVAHAFADSSKLTSDSSIMQHVRTYGEKRRKVDGSENGNHRWTVRAHDAAGNTTTSAVTIPANGSSWTSIGPGVTNWVMSGATSLSGAVYLGLDIGGVYKSTEPGGTSWAPMNRGLRNPYVFDLAVDPSNESIVYAATRGGIFKSLDGGASWTPKRNGIGGPAPHSVTANMGSLAIVPSNPTTLFAGVGDWRDNRYGLGRIFTSVDGGESWTASAVGSSTNIVSKIAAAPTSPSIVYAATFEGLFKSNDGGASWRRTGNGLPHDRLRFVVVDPVVPSTLYVTLQNTSTSSFNGGIYKSTDGGATWAAATKGLSKRTDAGGNQYRWIAIDPANTAVLYLGEDSHLWSNGVYKSVDGGRAWTHVTRWSGNVTYGWIGDDGANRNQGANTILVDPTDSSRIYFGATSTSYTSSDGGQSWSQMYSNKTANGWSSRGIDVLGGVRTVAVDPAHPSRIYMGTYDQGLVKSNDGGASWRRIRSGIPSDSQNVILALTMDPANPQALFGSAYAPRRGSSTLIASSDRGESWRAVGSGLPAGQILSIVIDPRSAVDSRTLYATVSGAGVFKSTDSGVSWSPTGAGLPGGPLYSMGLDPTDPRVIYVAAGGSDGGVFVSRDAAATWRLIPHPQMVDVRGVTVDSRSNVYAVTAHRGSTVSGVFRLSARDSTWSRLMTPHYGEVDYGAAIVVDPTDPNLLYAGFSDDNYHDEVIGSGVYVSRDGGNTWREHNDGLASTRIFCLFVDPLSNRVFVGTHGAGLYYR